MHIWDHVHSDKQDHHDVLVNFFLGEMTFCTNIEWSELIHLNLYSLFYHHSCLRRSKVTLCSCRDAAVESSCMIPHKKQHECCKAIKLMLWRKPISAAEQGKKTGESSVVINQQAA